ncbi:hypothetical protein C2845_PM15G09550 [Panicum miliaceum]|uniref:Uncharacterized protein n=1 Tax=Panicum miliaceum TaxID=4540 RepID=A0A3L6Q6R3_PANMI|nr:hypothetical protein C2845_PM15G09550 [Panicum miliaceum]
MEEVGRTSKIMMMTEVPEESGIREMLDNMMMAGHEALIRDMEKLRIAMDNKEKKKNRKGCSKVTRDMMDLSTLLIRCAQAVDTNNYLIADELLRVVRWLAKREGGPPPEMKITAMCCSQPSSFPVQWIEEQRYRLSKYASELGLTFVFEAVTTEWEKVCIENLNIDADEVVVVSDLFNFSTLKDESVFFDSPNPRDTVLSNIKKMRPNIFIQSILNCSQGACFLSRFREMLFYYSALFDMLDVIVPQESESRSVLEQDLFGSCVLNGIGCEGVDLVQRPEKQWQSRNQGLRQLPLRPVVMKVLKDKVKKHHHKEFLLSEEGQWLLQGWKGRAIFAHSTWVVEDGSSE